MESTIIMMCLCFMFSAVNSVQATEQYWPAIKQYRLEGKKAKDRETFEATGKKYEEYIASLSPRELMEAARECSQEADAREPGATYCKEYLDLIGILGKPYVRAGGLNSLDTLFKEIEDKKQTNLLRATLVELLKSSGWIKQLTDEQLYSVINRMQAVILDKTEHFSIRYNAINATRNYLAELERRNLLADPVVQMKLKESGDAEKGVILEDIKKAVAEGQLELSDNYKSHTTQVLKSYNDYAQVLLTIRNESTLNQALQRMILVGLNGCAGKKLESTAHVRKALEDSVRNYD